MSEFNPSEHLTDLRGQQYMEVKWRLVWFRAEHPSGSIETEVINITPPLLKATIYDGNGVRLATGHASIPTIQTRAVWTGREIEKAETAAIGRALAHAGYGTQFAGEEEGEFLADSPVNNPPTPPNAPAAQPRPANGKPAVARARPPARQPAPAAVPAPEPDPLVEAAADLGGEPAQDAPAPPQKKLPSPRKGWHADAALIQRIQASFTGQPAPEIINRLRKMAAEGLIALDDLPGRVLDEYVTYMETHHKVVPDRTANPAA